MEPVASWQWPNGLLSLKRQEGWMDGRPVGTLRLTESLSITQNHLMSLAPAAVASEAG